ncbi:MAG: GatB/YqeY domain-containing protein [Gammaproteobacteria bacterium]|nr:GatB/YqeY domain-containing protein [Gammaproteobacteria bacterium]MYD80698.1 GatB/YqeY domain-containing protein [Gammaproteobacteria bacterium]
MTTSLQARIADATRTAMRERERRLVAALRLIKAELQQAEVEAREPLDDSQVLAILNRMIKQRRGSAEQYLQGNRKDLADQEDYEIEVIQRFTPKQLNDEELRVAIDSVCDELSAVDMKQMGQVMRKLASDLAGQAEMSRVGALVRERLTG